MALKHGGLLAQSLAEAVEDDAQSDDNIRVHKLASVSTHLDSITTHVLINPSFLDGLNVKEGSVLQMHDLSRSEQGNARLSGSYDGSVSNVRHLGDSNAFVFIVKYPTADVLATMANMQLSLPQSLSEGLKIQKNASVMLGGASKDRIQASHVEIFFRDQYLTRADMWRLINDQIVNRCVYKGQKVSFMNNITVEIKKIHCNGRLVKSALFTPLTKPIFRSRSARYVIFIQMSKEMWEFDAEGSGEIMFDKVVNGFLPQLFSRWKEIDVRHLVSIVFFTRMEYDHQSTAQFEEGCHITDQIKRLNSSDSKDFYRVVVSDTASIESADIMERLKREFQVFLRDVSLRRPEAGQYTALGAGLSAASADLPSEVIAGTPSPASRGNVLEAIALASSQFSSDYIDRDLVRTGVSIVIISPGTGVFDVDYSTLIATTENLTENGVGIDLVCLSQMPLHSVPLFRYKQPFGEDNAVHNLAGEAADTSASPSSNVMKFGTPNSHRASGAIQVAQNLRHVDRWNYGIPHWVDISYWSKVQKPKEIMHRRKSTNSKKNAQMLRDKAFVPRVRMYELQMMGVMGETLTSISIPMLTTMSRTSSGKGILIQPDQPISRSHRGPSPNTLPIKGSSPRKSSVNVRNELASTDGHPHERTLQAQATSKWMYQYDEHVFCGSEHLGRQSKMPATELTNQKNKDARISRGESGFEGSYLSTSKAAVASTGSSTTHQSQAANAKGQQFKKSSLSSILYRTSSRPDTGTRKISFGPRGLGVATPTAAAAIATTDTFNSQIDLRTDNSHHIPMVDTRIRASDSKQQGTSFQAIKLGITDAESVDDSDDNDTAESITDLESSRPIPIKKTINQTSIDERDSTDCEDKDGATSHDRVATLRDMSSKRRTANGRSSDTIFGPELPTLSPSTTLAPWLTVLNPCNPSKHSTSSTSRLGRWQHLFPRPPKVSSIKWLSLCSPAAVPLTTEDFPSTQALLEDYRERSYTIHLPHGTDSDLQYRLLVNELVAFRLARGFQIVVGKQVASHYGPGMLEERGIFNEHLLSQAQAWIWLLRGGTIHQIKRAADDRVDITTFTRHATLRPPLTGDDSFVQYTPLIRSMLARDYEPHSIPTAPQRDPFNWESIDGFIVGHERPQAEQYVDTLRPWRGRFVLIPMYSPAESRRTSRDKDLTAEENRLEGIRRLTHLWQKARYIIPEERRFTKTRRLKEDANPLDVQYYTKNPSEVVNEELNHAVLSSSYKTLGVQLLPEADLLQRSSLNTKIMAEKVQSDKGVRIVDRRWHWKLHHYCFIGSELTSWILENFKDIYSRDEAVDLGNELMQDGLFRHVEKRHNFLDGHYFYQIADEYRAPRVESRGFFGWGKASVPATPLKDTPSAESPSTKTASSGANIIQGADGESHLTDEVSSRPSIALGKSLIFNLLYNRSQLSYREELLNIHFDRLHNPDTCYHIRLEWMNATPKLVQNAINHWAHLVEPYGLRLVEVPIGEASAIRSNHPFRSPYTISLYRKYELGPPLAQYNARSFKEQETPQNHLYQEAILKRFGYVLDFEAASAFPPNVDVTYSWGKPDYKYAQYIHRSGLLIAQITDDGDIMVLANRLYNDKSSRARAKSLDGEVVMERSAHIPRASPLRPGDTLTQRQRRSPRSSPSPSPGLKATLDVPSTPGPANRSPLSQISSAQQTHHPSVDSMEQTTTAERMTRDLQAFCEDEQALEMFYREQVDKLSSSAPQTPMMSARQTPLRISERIGEESGIPELTLPSSLTDREGAFKQGFEMKQEGWQRRHSESPTSKAMDKKTTIGDRSPLSRPR